MVIRRKGVYITMSHRTMGLYVLLVMLVIGWIGVFPTFAEESTLTVTTAGEQIDQQEVGEDELILDEERVSKNTKPAMGGMVTPVIKHTPIEKWRLGLNLTMTHILGSDKMRLWGDYSFHAKTVNGGLEYCYKLGHNSFYGAWKSDTQSFGLFDQTSFYEHERSAVVGGSRTYFGDSYFYVADAHVKLIERNPYILNGMDRGFDAGTDLYIQPTIFGAYQGYQGKLKLNYGIPTEISDYNYVKVDLLAQKGFHLTKKDQIIVAGEAGILRGKYPTQVEFNVGSGPGNITPNFWSKIFGVGSTNGLYTEPVVYLHGYEDNALSGSNMFVGKVEYQRKLSTKMPFGVYPVAKVFTNFGNAFDGTWSEGIRNTKAALGVGMNLETALQSPGSEQNWYVGMNLAKGFGEKSVWTFGIDLGISLDLLSMFLME